MVRVPHVRPGEWRCGRPAGRLASLVREGDATGCRVALLGLADDTGVVLNGGRAGARGGPTALRAALGRYGVAEPAGWRWPGVFDAGDVEAGTDLEETHARVTEAAGALLDAGMVPVGIGGGHDLTFALVRALAERSDERLVGVYFDAHLDVRAEAGSGMVMRRLVEACGVRELFVFGMDEQANAAEHVDWFLRHCGRIDAFEPGDPWPEGRLFVSLDLDVIDQAYAPGVSAMNPCGWPPALAERWAREAGRCAGVGCFDIMELNPEVDEGGRTARLAARLLLSFLRGFSERRA